MQCGVLKIWDGTFLKWEIWKGVDPGRSRYPNQKLTVPNKSKTAPQIKPVIDPDFWPTWGPRNKHIKAHHSNTRHNRYNILCIQTKTKSQQRIPPRWHPIYLTRGGIWGSDKWFQQSTNGEVEMQRAHTAMKTTYKIHTSMANNQVGHLLNLFFAYSRHSTGL